MSEKSMQNTASAGRGAQPLPWGQALLLLGLVAFIIALPYIFTSGHSLSLLSQMGIAIIFALSYNMLLGQGGMLSFGHAVYFGLGGFITAHVLNMVGDGRLPIPLELMPLVGGLGGLAFAIPLGYINTKRGGVSFAMITLGIGELVAASSLMFTDFFGGEAGVSTNRVTEVTLLPFDYGPSIQVYYLIVVWMLLSVIAMYLLTKTPLGKMANAVRDNSERAEFVGYNPRVVSFIQFSIAGFFAGIAGGLFAINYEILTADTVGVQQSGLVLLMTFIGGVGYFFGPILGAILITYLSISLSNITEAWVLYFGLLFVLMVMYAPSGLAGIIMLHRPVWRARKLQRLLVPYVVMAIPALVLFFGAAAVIEMAYHRSASYDPSTPMQLFLWKNVVITTVWPWLFAGLAIVLGALGLRWAMRRFKAVWDEIHLEMTPGGGA